MNQTHVPDFLFYNTVDHERLTWHAAALLLFFFCFVPGANQKKPSAPDMFTESDDMFAADFDVSALSYASELAVLRCCHVKMEAEEEFPAFFYVLLCYSAEREDESSWCGEGLQGEPQPQGQLD